MTVPRATTRGYLDSSPGPLLSAARPWWIACLAPLALLVSLAVAARGDESAATSNGRVPLRRLNRREYEQTLRDLLEIDVELADLLPEDSAAHGFDNTADGQSVSPYLLERYLEAADRALSLAIANGPAPPRIEERYFCRNQHQVRNASENVFHTVDTTTVFFTSSPWQAMTLSEFYPPHRGRYRFRIAASAMQSDGHSVGYRVLAGPMLMGTRNHLVGYVDAPAGEPAEFEFTIPLEARSTINLLPHNLARSTEVHARGAEQWTGPGLAIHHIDVEGPLHDAWPPASHTRLLGDLPRVRVPEPDGAERYEVVSTAPREDAARILQRFADRAFRRAVDAGEVVPFLDLTERQLAAGRTFEQALRAGLTGILMSPEFLFVSDPARNPDDFALANRLSYFLWSTLPDEELQESARRGVLSQPGELRRQTDRLLDDPRSQRFVESFVGQWLGLRNIDATEPSHILYPEFDELLKVSMVREVELFFAERLRSDASLRTLISADFSFLNGRLAQHYGIPGVEGLEFRRVPLPAESHRGGLLTMAGVLKVTANGTTTSPVVRGAWVLDRILGTPPSNPPDDVPLIEPDIRGATTIRDQLARHRHDPACAVCHDSIDPPGFALESFDAIGGWRENYRTTGTGSVVLRGGRPAPYLQGPVVDSSGELPDGTRFQNIDEFRQLLLRDPDALARPLLRRLITYATGAPPRDDDQPLLETLLADSRGRDHRLRSLLHAVVQSPLFHSP